MLLTRCGLPDGREIRPTFGAGSLDFVLPETRGRHSPSARPGDIQPDHACRPIRDDSTPRPPLPDQSAVLVRMGKAGAGGVRPPTKAGRDMAIVALAGPLTNLF